MPVVLKRWSVPTGEPDNTERVPSGSVGGWGKRSVSYLARSLPNLVPRSRFQARLRPGVRRQHLLGFIACCRPSHCEIPLLHARDLSQNVTPILGTAPRQRK